MTDARDALAELIREYPTDPTAAADAILAAGWRAPSPTRWECGHEIAVGAWGHNGECISCAHKRWESG